MPEETIKIAIWILHDLLSNGTSTQPILFQGLVEHISLYILSKLIYSCVIVDMQFSSVQRKLYIYICVYKLDACRCVSIYTSKHTLAHNYTYSIVYFRSNLSLIQVLLKMINSNSVKFFIVFSRAWYFFLRLSVCLYYPIYCSFWAFCLLLWNVRTI